MGFTGRACRSEFWYWTLFVYGVSFGLIFLLPALGFGFQFTLIGNIFGLVVLLPDIAVCIRRLHDLDKSGWWLLLAFVPLIGPIILIIWFAGKGTDGSNQFGADPLSGAGTGILNS